ncbi:MAG: amino acid ABC transporter permease, partial [Actinomycetes bacterium]
ASVVPLGLIAAIYIAINYALSRFAVALEQRLSRRGRSSAKKVVDQSDPELNPGGGGSGA